MVRFASLAQAHDYNDSAGLREVLNQAGADAAGRRVEFYDEA